MRSLNGKLSLGELKSSVSMKDRNGEPAGDPWDLAIWTMVRKENFLNEQHFRGLWNDSDRPNTPILWGSRRAGVERWHRKGPGLAVGVSFQNHLGVSPVRVSTDKPNQDAQHSDPAPAGQVLGQAARPQTPVTVASR